MRKHLFLLVFLVITLFVIGCGPNISEKVRDLENPSADVREKALKDLVEIGDPAVAPVIEIIGSKNATTRTIASDVMIEIGESCIAPLLKVIDDSKSDSIKAGQAVYIIGELGEKYQSKVEDILIKHVTDPRYAVRVNTIAALGKIKSEKSIKDLNGILEKEFESENPEWNVITILAKSIGMIGQNGANEILFKYLNSKKTPLHIKKDIATYIEGVSTNAMREDLIKYVTNLGGKKHSGWGTLDGMKLMSVLTKTLGSMPKSKDLINILLDIQKYYGFDDTFYPKVIYSLDKIGPKDKEIQSIIDKLEVKREKLEKKGK